jgi:hypothetical protein
MFSVIALRVLRRVEVVKLESIIDAMQKTRAARFTRLKIALE